MFKTIEMILEGLGEVTAIHLTYGIQVCNRKVTIVLLLRGNLVSMWRRENFRKGGKGLPVFINLT